MFPMQMCKQNLFRKTRRANREDCKFSKKHRNKKVLLQISVDLQCLQITLPMIDGQLKQTKEINCLDCISKKSSRKKYSTT